MKKALVILAVVLFLLVACTGTNNSKPAEEQPAPQRPGVETVYDRIEGLTDCGELQREFDEAAANNARYEAGSELFGVTLSYMEAANERQQELGCA